MNYRIVPEEEFRQRAIDFVQAGGTHGYRSVTGPGRSGAVAAVYVSHRGRIPFLPYGTKVPSELEPILVVDTATWTGRTLRKAARKYGTRFHAFYKESPGNMVKFWYEHAA